MKNTGVDTDLNRMTGLRKTEAGSMQVRGCSEQNQAESGSGQHSAPWPKKSTASD